jgi:magnesium transporter
MDYFGKQYHPPGTSPGTLKAHPELGEIPLQIKLINYSPADYVEKGIANVDECRDFLAMPAAVTWMHFQGHIDPEELRTYGDLVGLHTLAMEDILNRGQLPKIDEYEDQIFLVMNLPTLANGGTRTEQVAICIGRNYLLSFYAGKADPFDPIRKRLIKKSGRIRSLGVDYLLYTLLDLVIDQAFPILERYGDVIEELEEELLDRPTKSMLIRIHALRRELLFLRRFLWPQREVLNTLMRGEHLLITGSIHIYLRDCYDHTVQIMELLENYRDMATSMLDVYLSSVSNRLNDTMRLLTVIATIFIPLTFIVGVYGMNFQNQNSPWAMPELHWYYGYPLVWGVMIAIVIGMLIYFKRRDWL